MRVCGLLACCGLLAALEGVDLARLWEADGALAVAPLLSEVREGHEHQIWRARCAISADPQRARALLKDIETGPGALPVHLQGLWALVTAEALLASPERDEQRVQRCLGTAIRCGGPGVARDRVLALLADSCRRAGDQASARRCHRALWHGWPTSPYRIPAGLALIEDLARNGPLNEARRMAAALAIRHDVNDAERRRAYDAVLRALAASRPQQARALLAQLRRDGLDTACWDDLLAADAAPTPLARPPTRADDPLRALAALHAAGAQDAARRQLATALTQAEPAERVRLLQIKALWWPQEQAAVDAALRAIPLRAAAVGEAWARSAAQDPDAWLMAVRYLPDAHPWLASACLALARQVHAAQGRGAPWPVHGDLLLERLEACAWDADDADVRYRCRFQLARLLIDRGRGAQALPLLASLRPHADARQERLIDALHAQIAAR